MQTAMPPTASSNSKEGISVNQLALPKGGGAIQGIGETFQADEFAGTASFSLPLPVSACRGFEPKLELAYSSGAGNSPFGVGWSVTAPSVARKTSKGQPRYVDDDTFIISSAEDLVPVEGSEGSATVDEVTFSLRHYRPRVEAGFARIEFWQAQDGSGHSFWRTITAQNVTSVFGYDQQSRIVDPGEPSHVFEWLLTCSYDAHGNGAYYQYKQENTDNVSSGQSEQNHSHTAHRYLDRVCYGNASSFQPSTFPDDLTDLIAAQWHFELVLDYGEYASALQRSNPYGTDG